MDSIDKEHDWGEGRSPLQTPQAKEQRRRIRPWAGVASAIVLGVVLALAWGFSYAEEKAPVIAPPTGPSRVIRSVSEPTLEPMVLRIYIEAPCAHTKLVTIISRMGGAPILHLFKAASVLWEGKTYAGCWINDRRGNVLTIFEDNSDLPPIPMRAFRDESL